MAVILTTPWLRCTQTCSSSSLASSSSKVLLISPPIRWGPKHFSFLLYIYSFHFFCKNILFFNAKAQQNMPFYVFFLLAAFSLWICVRLDGFSWPSPCEQTKKTLKKFSSLCLPDFFFKQAFNLASCFAFLFWSTPVLSLSSIVGLSPMLPYWSKGYSFTFSAVLFF